MTLDIYLPAAQLGRQSYVLSFLADSQGKLIIRNDYCSRFFFLVNQDLLYLGRAENILDQDVRIIVPCGDVDLFSKELVDDVLDTTAACADACAYRIHVFVFCVYGDLRSGTSLTGDALDLYRTVFDFRHFQFKQLFYKARVRSGKEDLRTLGALSYIHDVRLDPVVDLVAFSGSSLSCHQDTFGVAHVYKNRLIADSLNHTCDQVTLTADVVVEDHAPLRLADPLHNHLFRSLCRDTPEVSRRYLVFYHIAYLVSRIDLQSLFQRDLRKLIFHLVYYVSAHENVHISIFPVDVDSHVLRSSVVFLICGNKCRFDRFDQDILRDSLFFY